MLGTDSAPHTISSEMQSVPLQQGWGRAGEEKGQPLRVPFDQVLRLFDIFSCSEVGRDKESIRADPGLTARQGSWQRSLELGCGDMESHDCMGNPDRSQLTSMGEETKEREGGRGREREKHLHCVCAPTMLKLKLNSRAPCLAESRSVSQCPA